MIIKKEFLDIKKMSFEKALEELEKITNDFEEGSPKIDQVKTLNHKFISRATEDSGEQN